MKILSQNRLEAFIATQKFSVMRQMRRQFARYPAFKRNHNDELLFKLKDLVKNKLALRRARPRSVMSDATNEPEDLMNDMEIGEEELADKVDELSSQSIGTCSMCRCAI